jgi:hypothetical protein
MISRIRERVSQSGGNNDKAFIRTILRISKEFGYLPNEVLKLPIPQYMVIVEEINEMDRKRKNGNK